MGLDGFGALFYGFWTQWDRTEHPEEQGVLHWPDDHSISYGHIGDSDHNVFWFGVKASVTSTMNIERVDPASFVLDPAELDKIVRNFIVKNDLHPKEGVGWYLSASII